MTSLFKIAVAAIAAAASMPMASALPGGSHPGPHNFDATVSSAWLASHLSDSNVVTIDLRSPDEYAAGHIPGSVSVPFDAVSAWSNMGPGDLLLEMPPATDVFATLASIGVSNPTPATKVVLVYGVGVPAFPQAAAPRVATTLKYAGISEGRVAVLDGGYPGWVAAGKPTTTTPTPPRTPGSYTATPDTSFLVDIEYVHARINRIDEGIVLLDGRDAAVYNGSVVEPWAAAPGHIPSALSLPAVGIWNPDGSYKRDWELLRMVRDVVGHRVNRRCGEIIVYCGVGGYASSWYFVLTRILGFENVVMYDGSAQEWSLHYPMEL